MVFLCNIIVYYRTIILYCTVLYCIVLVIILLANHIYNEFLITGSIKIEACVYKTLGGVNEKCKEQFEDAMVCLAKYPKQWSKCTQIRAKLEECAVANKLGDISKM